MSANDKQIGGAHYRVETGIPQHWDVVIALGWDYLTGNATKYLWRLGKKGGPEKELEDLQKAIHYLEKKQELLRAKLAQGSAGVGAQVPAALKRTYPSTPSSGSWEQMDTPTKPYGSMVRPLGESHPAGALMGGTYAVPEHDGGPTRAYVDQD